MVTINAYLLFIDKKALFNVIVGVPADECAVASLVR
jgi:hypothetical protein